MVTPTDALIEFVPGTLVVAIAQELHQINKGGYSGMGDMPNG